jgi:hypothetical protein
MKIELIQSQNRAFCADIVITHHDDTITLTRAYTDFIGHEEETQAFAEINAHWARRSDNNQTAIFQLYAAMINCVNNYPHLADVNGRERMVIESIRPFAIRLLHLHRWDGVKNFWDNTYSDDQLGDFLHTPPTGVTEDQMYTLSEYRDLQVFMITMRTLTPIVVLLQKAIMEYSPRQYSMGELYKELYRTLFNPHLEIVQSPGMKKLQRYVKEMVKNVPMRRTREIEVDDLVPGLIFNRMAKAPISRTRPHSFVVSMHTYTRQKINYVNRTPEEQERSHRVMENVLSTRNTDS